MAGNRERIQTCYCENTIEEIVSNVDRIPVQKGKNEQQRLLKLESILHKRVVGQTEAVTAVAKAVRRGRVGLKVPIDQLVHFCFWDLQV